MRGIAAFTMWQLASGSGMLLAQAPSGLEPGRAVRVAYDCQSRPGYGGGTVTRCRTDRGILVGLTMDSISWRPSAGASDRVEGLPLADLDRLEVRVSRARSWALVGLLAGGAVGVAVPLMLARQPGWTSPWECLGGGEDGGACAALAFGSLIGGAALGAGIGALIRTEGWRTLPLESLRITVMPQRSGPAASVAVPC